MLSAAVVLVPLVLPSDKPVSYSGLLAFKVHLVVSLMAYSLFAIAALQAMGITATGPHPADALFVPRARHSYDVAICMYHDQALIPLKTLDFDSGVNITLGLPIIRTSPDHGTAFAIAGKQIADPGATIAALGMAGDCAARRATA